MQTSLPSNERIQLESLGRLPYSTPLHAPRRAPQDDDSDSRTGDMTTTVSYEEPSLPHLLTLLSFLFLLQLFRGAAERVLKAGLLGEIAVGVIYGTAGILPVQWEQTFLVVGYLGLVLIVFEGPFPQSTHVLNLRLTPQVVST